MTTRKPLLTGAVLLASTVTTYTITTDAQAAPGGFGTVVPAHEVVLDEVEGGVVASVAPGAVVPMTITTPAEIASVVVVDDDGAPLGIWGTDGVAVWGTGGVGMTPSKKVLASGDLVALYGDEGEDEVGLTSILAGEDTLLGIGIGEAQPDALTMVGSSAVFEEGLEDSPGSFVDGIWGSSGTFTGYIDGLTPLEAYIDAATPLISLKKGALAIDGLWSSDTVPALLHGIGTMGGIPVAIRIDASPLLEVLPEVDDEVRPIQMAGTIGAILGGTGRISFGPTDDCGHLESLPAASFVGKGGTDLFCSEEECLLGPDDALIYASIEVTALDG